jgi:cytochrome d ubiquinol oxidase subunit I
MEDALFYHRLQFAFTISFHYIFPQLTMGLSFVIVLFKSLAIKKQSEIYNKAAKFWAKIFAINFIMGVVTGIPMEFQFGTNWARFSELTGSIIGQTLAMEGMFSFFLESMFLGLFLYGEERIGQRWHLVSAVCVFLGSWLSGYFIIVTHAWMQLPVGYSILENGSYVLEEFSALFRNPWATWEYLHTMMASLVTTSFVISAIGAYYLLRKKEHELGRLFLRFGVVIGFIASVLVAFPTGDKQANLVAKHQPITLAAMEGHFKTDSSVAMVMIGQPNMETMTLDNPIYLPNMLSFLVHQDFHAEVLGLDAFPKEDWPTNIPLLYYSYHIMIGLGTLFIALMGFSSLNLYWKKLYERRWLLWTLMLALPFPYIATQAGWMTAELGRQPWLVYNLLRTVDGSSHMVSAGNTLFTLLGFMGIYFLLGILFLTVVGKIVQRGLDD